jgi:hypothetical protein
LSYQKIFHLSAALALKVLYKPSTSQLCHLSPWRWRQHVSTKRRNRPTNTHGAKTQDNANNMIIIAVRTSNLSHFHWFLHDVGISNKLRKTKNHSFWEKIPPWRILTKRLERTPEQTRTYQKVSKYSHKREKRVIIIPYWSPLHPIPLCYRPAGSLGKTEREREVSGAQTTRYVYANE